MIDVMKRLAELDAGNPNIVRESTEVSECGMMPEMSPMAMDRPSTPATINMTAGSGEELSDMLTTIMSLAGIAHKGADAEPMGNLPPPAEPEMGPETPADTMRGVIDKLNTAGGDDEGGEEDDQEKTDEEKSGPYDSSPNDPRDVPAFDAEKFAHQENQPGQGDRMDGDRPKAFADMNEAVADLFAQYKQFIGEAEETETDEDVEEGFVDAVKKGVKAVDKFVTGGDKEDLIKDLQKNAGVPQTGKAPNSK